MRLAGSCLLAMLVVLSWPSTARADDSAALFVHIVDCAGVSSVAMNAAEHEMTRAFGASGVRALWRDQPSGVATPSGPNHVTVVLLSTDMTKRKVASDAVPINALATAAPLPARRAWVFVDRVEQVAAKQHASVGAVLGIVIAHEVGHVAVALAHTGAGVMGRDLQMAELLVPGFSPEQGTQIRAALRGAAPGAEGPPTQLAALGAWVFKTSPWTR